MKNFFTYFFAFGFAILVAAIPISIIGYFYDYSFMDILKTSTMVVASFFFIFILLFSLPFILTMHTGSDTMERDKSLLLWIIAAAVLMGGGLSLFNLGDFKEIVSWIILGFIFLSFIGFFFSKEKYEKPNGAVPWDPHWVPKLDNSEDEKIELDEDKKPDV